jgi:hypothetical protein
MIGPKHVEFKVSIRCWSMIKMTILREYFFHEEMTSLVSEGDRNTSSTQWRSS